MSVQPFTHLHLHTEYSLLDGANKISNLVERVKELGMTSVAMTDHGNMFGAIDFYQQMKAAGIKPILGMEGYIHNGKMLNDKSTKQRFHVCLFAKNMVGYKNLMYLSSQSYIDGFYYFPRINKELLRNNSEGIICTSACLQGEVNWHLNLKNERNIKNGAGGYDEAKRVALEYKEIFGEDFYLEIMRHGIVDQHYIDNSILRIAKETGIKVVATNDTHYTFPGDAQYHEAFMCIGMNKLYDDPNRMRHSVHEFYVKSPEQMERLFADIPEALIHTQEIVQKCNVELNLGNPTPPDFKFTQEYATQEGMSINHEDDAPLPESASEEDKKKWFSGATKNDIEYFIYRCKVGLDERLKHVPQERHQEYIDRLIFEMDIINSMKFPGYMLIVWDFVKVAKEMDIAVGPGRGSAAGSLVAYSLEITDIDPMKYDLLFERFLNPERVSMPDIDMDFMQARRGEIIDYVVKKYGRNQVAQIITFGSLLAKGVIRDVARVLDMPLSQADKMAKLIPDELGITLNGKMKKGEVQPGAFQKEPKIKELIEQDSQAARVWEFAKKLEGLKRNAGMHAAGVVISNEELWHKTPIYKPSGDDQPFVTQYSLNYLEDIDLIKFDFLGLKTLDVIQNATKLIKKIHNIDVDWHKIDENDPKVYETIQHGDTIGMFQIESSGMQDLNKRLKPDNFEDLIAVLALYRPGPMESGMLDSFIERKHGREAIEYTFDSMEVILKPTYGVIVYQEQVMQIVQSIGGFSLGYSDIIRRAMGKKKDMATFNAEFSQGAKKQGYDYQKASQLFDLIEKFAGYGFNKSHSAAYAMVTFQTAWLKVYYPEEFMSALLTSERDNTDKIVKYIDEVNRMGITLSPPDINQSHLEFAPVVKDGQSSILFGLGAIKGVGSAAVESILEVRKEGEFIDMQDFVNRIEPQKVNKRVLESVCKSGGFDAFAFSRRAILEQIDIIIETTKNASNAKKNAFGSLFGDDAEVTTVALELKNAQEYGLKEILEFEKETLGFYVSGHPLDDYREAIDDLNYTLSSDIENIADGSTAIFIGKVEEITKKISKKGNAFGILNLMDFHGNIEMMLFSDKLEQLQEMDLDEPVAFKVKITHTEMFTRIGVLKIFTLKEVKKESKKVKTTIAEKPPEPMLLSIHLNNNTDMLEELYRLIRRFPGKRSLKLIIVSKLQNVVLESAIGVDSKILEELEKLDFVDVM